MNSSLSATAKAALKIEVLECALNMLEQGGPSRFRVTAVALQFEGRGVAKSTLFRWIGAAVECGELGQALGRRLKAAAHRRRAVAKPEAEPDTCLEAAKSTLARLPRVTSLDDIASEGSVGIVTYLNECIAAARKVMAYAKTADGNVRSAKLLLFGSEHLRRCLETANRIVEKVRELQKVEEFHDIIMQEIRKESPATALAILARVDQVARDWGAI